MAERTLQSQIDDLIDRESDSLRVIADGQAAFHRGYRACLANLRRQLTDLNPTPAPLDVPVCPDCARAPEFTLTPNGTRGFGCPHAHVFVGVEQGSGLHHVAANYREAVAAWRRDHPEETA